MAPGFYEYMVKSPASQVLFDNSLKFYHSTFGLDKCIRFVTPIIVQSAGNLGGFFKQITNRWDEFHAITFYGGNINSIFIPQMAIDSANTQNILNLEGVREIKRKKPLWFLPGFYIVTVYIAGKSFQVGLQRLHQAPC